MTSRKETDAIQSAMQIRVPTPVERHHEMAADSERLRKKWQSDEMMKKAVHYIDEEYCAANDDAISAIRHAIRAGRLLMEVKAVVGHGNWMTWLGWGFQGSPRTAQNYMQLWKHQVQFGGPDAKRVSFLGVRAALDEIRRPRPPEDIPEADVPDPEGIPEDNIPEDNIPYDAAEYVFAGAAAMTPTKMAEDDGSPVGCVLVHQALVLLDSIPVDDEQLQYAREMVAQWIQRTRGGGE